MPIEYKRNLAVFRDTVSIEDAEGLLAWLQKKPKAGLDLSACSHLHPANLQLLMAAKNKVELWPADANLNNWLKTVLNKTQKK